jgi:hypothetical protein
MDLRVFALLALLAVLRSALRCGERIVYTHAATAEERVRCATLTAVAEALEPGAILVERRADGTELAMRGGMHSTHLTVWMATVDDV